MRSGSRTRTKRRAEAEMMRTGQAGAMRGQGWVAAGPASRARSRPGRRGPRRSARSLPRSGPQRARWRSPRCRRLAAARTRRAAGCGSARRTGSVPGPGAAARSRRSAAGWLAPGRAPPPQPAGAARRAGQQPARQIGAGSGGIGAQQHGRPPRSRQPRLPGRAPARQTARSADRRHRDHQPGTRAPPWPAPRRRMLAVSSRTKTDTGRRTRICMLTPNDASPLPRAQKERRGTVGLPNGTCRQPIRSGSYQGSS
jgi:hypothetical protein